MARDKPETPFVLSLIGGIFVLVDGALGFMFSVRYGHWPMWIWEFAGDEYVLGPVGIVMGILIVLSATLAYKRTQEKTIWGILIVIASLISFFVILGGYVVGFVFAMIGGIMYFVWEPAETKRCVRCGRTIMLDSIFCPYCGVCYAPGLYYYPGQQPVQQPQTAQQTPGAQQVPTERLCAKCGTKLLEGAAFCSNCGQSAG